MRAHDERMKELEFVMLFAAEAERRAPQGEIILTLPSCDPQAEGPTWFPTIAEEDLFRLCRRAESSGWLRALGSSYCLSHAGADHYIDRRWPGMRSRAVNSIDAMNVKSTDDQPDWQSVCTEIGSKLGAPWWAVAFVALPWFRARCP